MRKYTFEFEDLPWFPNTIRESMTDYLRYALSALKVYQPICPLLVELLNNTQSTQIIDLCSGGGGAIDQIKSNLDHVFAKEIKIILTDKFPNKNAFTFLERKTNGTISFAAMSVDASDVPLDLKGIRTIFSGFHHFDEPLAKSVIKNAVDARSGIGIFDGGERNVLAALATLIFHPIVFFLFTPFFKPFRWSRLVFTYLLPIIPICTIWDGIISIIRLYQPDQLLKLAKEADHLDYTWKAGKVKGKIGLRITYLIGYPRNISISV